MRPVSAGTPPVTARLATPDDKRWLILVAVAIAQLMVVLDSTIVNIAAGRGAVGPILGGVLRQYLWWRSTLYVNLVFVAISLAGELAWLLPRRPDHRPRVDSPGALLACVVTIRRSP
jgi:hypothetical protein